MYTLFVSELDGDQLVDFYWIDPVMVAERLAGKSTYAGSQEAGGEDAQVLGCT